MNLHGSRAGRLAKLLAGLLMAACASDPPQTFSEKQAGGNPYNAWLRQQSPALQAQLRATPFRLFRQAREVFLAEANKRAALQPVLQAFSDSLIHGDFEPLQMEWNEGLPRLEAFDSAERGPWWLDLYRIEAGAALIARGQSLKLWKPGACIESYTEALRRAGEKRSAASAAAAVRPLNFDEKPRFGDARERADWKRSDAALPEGFSAAVNAAFAPVFQTTSVQELRHLGPGYLLLLADQRYFELREISAAPLKAFTAAAHAGQMKSCERFSAGQRLYRQSGERLCFDFAGHSYALRELARRSWAPSEEDFRSESQLDSHLRWMCGQLAAAHAESWSPYERASLAFALTTNRLIAARLRAMSSEEADLVATAQRMALQDALSPPQP